MRIKNLKALRQQKGISQQECSDNTGIPLKTIKRYDKGGSVGNIDYAYTLSKYFNISFDELLEEEE